MLIKDDDPNKTAKTVLAIHRTVFGETPLERRIADIKEEADELVNYENEGNLKEELGDLLCSCYCLASEKCWMVDDLIKATLEKIKTRFNTGHYHKTGEAVNGKLG